MRESASKIKVYKIQKHFQNIMLVGMASKINKNYTYKCVDSSKHNGIRVTKLNMHTNQIIAHTFSHGTLDSVVSQVINTFVCVIFADFACHSYQSKFFKMLLYLVHLLFWLLH